MEASVLEAFFIQSFQSTILLVTTLLVDKNMKDIDLKTSTMTIIFHALSDLPLDFHFYF
jgi:hypothetical protein